MSLNNQLVRVQRTLLPALNTLLLKCIQTILETWHLTTSVYLCCRSLVYLWLYLAFKWGKLFCQMYATELQRATGSMLSRLIHYFFPVDNRRIQIQHMLDTVVANTSHALTDNSGSERSHDTTVTDVFEELLPFRALLKDVKTEKSRDAKVEMWMTIIVNSWTQLLLFPYFMVDLMITMALENWSDLQQLMEAQKNTTEGMEITAPSLPDRSHDSASLSQKAKEGLEELVGPATAIVRRCLYQFVSKSTDDILVEQLEAAYSTDDNKELNMEMIKTVLHKDDVLALVAKMQSSIEKYLPCFENVSVVDCNDDIIPLIESNSCTNIRKYLLDRVFTTECVPFLTTCFTESPSYTEADPHAKLLHLTVNISARLHKTVNRWLKYDPAVEDFLLNIRAV